MTSSDFYCDYVVNNKISVKKEIETQSVLAYHHTNPNWPVHIVVIPKQHISSLWDCDDNLLIEIFSIIRKMAKKLMLKYGACRILTNTGSYQDSKHLHWHLYVEKS